MSRRDVQSPWEVGPRGYVLPDFAARAVYQPRIC